MSPRNGSFHEWPPAGADDTGAQVAVLAERHQHLNESVKQHDTQLGALAAELGLVRNALSEIGGGIKTAKWAVPVLIVVAGSFFSTAIVVALKFFGKG